MNSAKKIEIKNIKDDALQRRKQAGLRFRWARERKNMSQAELAEAAKTKQQMIFKFETGLLKNPSFLEDACAVLGINVEWIRGTISYDDLLQQEISNRVFLPEIDTKGTETGQFWSIPPAALGLSPDQMPAIRIFEVVGDAMSPDLHPGDRVAVNTADTRPSPAGLFLIDDGHGLHIKRIEPLPAGKLRLSSVNPAYAPLDTASGDIVVHGRILMKMQRI